MTLRPAVAADVGPLAQLWHDAWRDGHIGHVPGGLLPHRTPGTFRERMSARFADATIATVGDELAGFVTVHEDELGIFVAAAARGTGVADTLLRHGETTIARTHDVAWLAVVPGNTRARRFYERSGWRDTGRFDDQADTADGPFPVPSCRYEKVVR